MLDDDPHSHEADDTPHGSMSRSRMGTGIFSHTRDSFNEYLSAMDNPSAADNASVTIPKELYTQAKFPGRLVMLGCGAIGQTILPMLLKHTSVTPDKMRIVTADEVGKSVADAYGIEFAVDPLASDNYAKVLKKHLASGDFLLNLTVDVASLDLIAWCQSNGCLYLDSSTERWPGFSIDPSLSPEQRTNYAQREELLEIKRKHTDGPTAIVNHGANPGLISHFIKAALLEIQKDAADGTTPIKAPKTRREWAELMRNLHIRTIQVAERDTQATKTLREKDEFVSTWSIDGLLTEATQPVEVGWGTHEKELPHDGHLTDLGKKSTIYLDRPGALTLVRSWTPREGSYHGFLITHDESLSTADYYTVAEGEQALYRPTVMYAYLPCDDTVLSLREYAGNNWKQPSKKRILAEEIEYGSDELGVLLLGHNKQAYWFGSDLSIAQVRDLAPRQNATSMQVAAGALAGVIWALENPNIGILEPEDLDFMRVLDIATPYLGTVHGRYAIWTPLRGRNDKEQLFPEDIATADPWQFKNFRVM